MAQKAKTKAKKDTFKVSVSPKVTFASAFNLFSPSIAAIRLNPEAMGLLVFLPLVLMAFGGAVARPGFLPSMGYSAVGFAYLLFLLCAPGAIIAELKGADKRRVDARTAFLGGLQLFWRFFGLIILLGLIFFVSLLLLVVPFFFVLPRYILAPYYLVDQNLSIGDALKQSAEDAKKYGSPIWGMLGVEVLIYLTGLVPFVGQAVSLVGTATFSAGPAIRYRQIQLAKKGKEPLTKIEASLQQAQSDSL